MRLHRHRLPAPGARPLGSAWACPRCGATYVLRQWHEPEEFAFLEGLVDIGRDVTDWVREPAR